MKTKLKLAAFAALLTIGVSAYADTYIRPELLWSRGEIKDFSSSKFGGGLVGGQTFGAQNEHDVSLELTWTNYTQTMAGGTDIKIRSLPLMVNYRYVFLEKDSPVRFYVGPSIGLNFVQITAGGNSKSDTSFTWGGTAGILWKVSDRINVDIGYRYAQDQVKIGDFNVNDPLKVNMVSVGVNFKF